MPRRRKPARQRSKAVHNAMPWNHSMHALEQRLLFTTFGGPGQSGIFEYEAEGGGVMRIAYNDVTFEALGVSVDPKTGLTAVGDLVQAGTTAPVAPILPMNLFTIFVTQSAADSFITVAPVIRQPKTPTVAIRADLPFGTGQPILVNPADGLEVPYLVTPGAGIGAGVLGAVTLPITGQTKADVPITAVPFPGGLGVYPADYFGDGMLHAGFYLPANSVTGAPQDIAAFKFAGEVFGNVQISGNIQLFYAGALLTGDATGIALPAVAQSPSATPNFTVGGDLHDLITSGDIGGDTGTGTFAGLANYDTGFAGSIGGKVGEIKELNGGFFGTINVIHSPAVAGLNDATPEQELEYQNTDVFIIGDPGGIGQIFQGDSTYLSTLLPTQLPAPFTNNTPDTAQYLGTAQTVDLNNSGITTQTGALVYDTEVSGTLRNGPTQQLPNGDPADWYAVAMLAGQSITISVTGGNQGAILAELQDPDGRLIASDAPAPASGVFRVKTDRPGIYRIGLLPDGTAAQKLDLTYLLKITGTGDEGLGALAVGGQVSDLGVDSFLTVSNGDFGGIVAVGDLISATTGPTISTTANAPIQAPSSIVVLNGSLRAVVAASVGLETGNVLSDGPYLNLPLGSVGLVQSTAGIIDLETQFDPAYLALPTTTYKTNDAQAKAIGGNIEVIDAATTLFGQIATNGGIGTIRAADMATTTPSFIDVNADNIGSDGIIDLIDVSGDFGVLGGGPEFETNNGGDVRYLQVGGTVYLPTAFGGVADEPTTYPAGMSNTFTDDGGVSITVTPDGPTSTANQVVVSGTTTTTTTVTTGPQVSVLTYPVLDKAGKIPISISSNGSLTLSASGNGGSENSAEIGTVSITGEGRPITLATTGTTGTTTGTTGTTGTGTTGTTGTSSTTDAYGNVLLQQPVATGLPLGITTGVNTDPTDEFLSITGSGRIDVLNTIATTTVAGNSPVAIANSTRGELVNLNTPGIGTLSVNGNLGFATPVATPAAVLPRAVIAGGNVYPFVQQHTGVLITNATASAVLGSAISIQVGGGVGNVSASGTIQSLIANYSQSVGNTSAQPILGQFDGIVGPIVAQRLLYVDVGQGLLPTGSGLVGLSGLYGTGKIGFVTNKGNPNGDIRGNIVSGEVDVTNVGIDAISLTNASIIGSIIATIAGAQFQETSALNTTTITVQENGTSFAPGLPNYIYDIGPITVSGSGGIIGTSVLTGSMASVNVINGGFGILTSVFEGQSAHRIGSITASGYGLRDDVINGASYVGAVSATGNGAMIPVTNYPIDVRPSDVAGNIDPYFGVASNTLIDINAVLGTSALFPNIPNVTDTGVVQDVVFSGGDDFAGLTAYKARTATPAVSSNQFPLPSVPNIPMLGTTFANSISFGGAIGYLRVANAIDGFQVTAGSIGQIAFGGGINRLGISVAGRINNFVARGNLGAPVIDQRTGLDIPDSYISAGGPNGTIGNLHVNGSLFANVSANGEIQNMQVLGDITGTITARAQDVRLGLGTLRVNGTIRDGALDISGSVGSIIVSGGLGTTAGTLNIQGNANLIQIGANRRVTGSALALALNVGGTLRRLAVYGRITGSVTTGGDLTNLNVQSDGTTANIISGNFTIGGRLVNANVIGGNIASDITASGYIGRFTITRGSLLEGATLQSEIDAIRSFNIVGGTAYDLLGSLIATNGLNESVNVSGNVGDGVNPALISASTGTTFHIGGSILNNATINTTFGLNQLRVDGNIATGATVTAHPLKKIKVRGTNTGTIIGT